MKINRDPLIIEFKHTSISFRNDWYCMWLHRSKLGKFNWLNFSLITIEFERAYYIGKYATLDITLMGLGIYFQWNWATEEEQKAWMKEIIEDE